MINNIGIIFLILLMVGCSAALINSEDTQGNYIRKNCTEIDIQRVCSAFSCHDYKKYKCPTGFLMGP